MASCFPLRSGECGEGKGEGAAAPAVCASGDCHGYALTKQMALLPAGHLNSHRNVGIIKPAAGASTLGLALEPCPGRPLQQLWAPGGSCWGCGQRECLPRQCCFWGKVRAGPACVRVRTRQLGCPECACARVCVSMCIHLHVYIVCLH